MWRWRWSSIMGRKAGALYINPKKFGAVAKPCMVEMVAFLNCLALNKQEDDKCVRQKDLLVMCTQTQVMIRITVKCFAWLGSVFSKHWASNHWVPNACLWHNCRKGNRRTQRKPSITISSDLGETNSSRFNGFGIISSSSLLPWIEGPKTNFLFKVALLKWGSNVPIILWQTVTYQQYIDMVLFSCY